MENQCCFWSALASQPNLSTLSMDFLNLNREEFIALWKACKVMRALHLGAFRVVNSTDDLLDDLEDPEDDSAFPELVTHLQQRRLQHLEQLTLSHVEDTVLSACLIAMARVTKLVIIGGSFGHLLSKHWNGTFRPSNFYSCPRPNNHEVTSAMVMTVLESCPPLSHIHVGQLMPKVILQLKLWVCLKSESVQCLDAD